MQPWQVIVIIVIYDIAKSLFTEYSNWKNETVENEDNSESEEISTSSIHCQHTDEEIAKSFIDDVEAVKEQLSCGDQMDFPNTFDEFVKDYGFKDKDEIYTNGSELIPVFRVKQWLEHISTTKNNIDKKEESEE